MTAPTVEVWFDLSATGGDFFTLDDATKGKLNDATYKLAGDIATDITADVHAHSITRGRSRPLDEINAGTATVYLRNYSGEFTPAGFGGDGSYGDNITVGKRVRISREGEPLFDGNIDDWEYSYSANGTVDARFTAVDALANLAAMDFDAWTTTASQTAGPRLTAVLDRSEVNYTSNRTLDTGVSTLQGDSVSWGSNVLNYCQLVVKSDLGRLFASRAGSLTFRDRHSLVNPAVKVAFADDGSGVGFQTIQPGYGSELLYTRVGVDREGGTLQTVDNATAQDKYRVRALSLTGLLLDSDTQSLEMAQFLSGIYSEPQAYVASIGVVVDSLPDTDRAHVLALDLADVVSVLWTPTGAATATSATNYVVEGVSHSHSYDGLHVVTLALSPISQGESFVLDDDVLGLLDSGVLAF